jgi:hypothetical protein
LLITTKISHNFPLPETVIPEEVEERKRGKQYVASIMKDYEDITGSDSMKLLPSVFDLETEKFTDVVLLTTIVSMLLVPKKNFEYVHWELLELESQQQHVF